MSTFDESKHHRNHGQFASGVALGAGIGVGATGGALAASALLGRRLRGFGVLARRGAAVATHAAAETLHETREVAPVALRASPSKPPIWAKMRHGAHTPRV